MIYPHGIKQDASHIILDSALPIGHALTLSRSHALTLSRNTAQHESHYTVIIPTGFLPNIHFHP